MLLVAAQLYILVPRSYDKKYFNFANVSVLCETNWPSLRLILKLSHALDGLFGVLSTGGIMVVVLFPE